MSRATTKKRPQKRGAVSSLMVRLDARSKEALVRAAELRGISISDYVRTVTVAQARRETEAAEQHVIRLTPEEQLALWTLLQETPRLTPAQRELGKLMRGEA